MNFATIIVGIDQWEEFTRPAVLSIQKHEPLMKIIVVDNASDPPYPFRPHDWDHPLPTIMRMNESGCYSKAINFGMKVSEADWTLVLNNDVLCTGPFIESHLSWMHPAMLYGNQLITYKKFRWLGLWLFVISAEVWRRVGKFDENFTVCGFDDADYCFRAAEKGIEIQQCKLPFLHYWGKTRWGIPGYPATRLENKAYLEDKHGFSIGDSDDWRVYN